MHYSNSTNNNNNLVWFMFSKPFRWLEFYIWRLHKVWPGCNLHRVWHLLHGSALLSLWLCTQGNIWTSGGQIESKGCRAGRFSGIQLLPEHCVNNPPNLNCNNPGLGKFFNSISGLLNCCNLMENRQKLFTSPKHRNMAVRRTNNPYIPGIK